MSLCIHSALLAMDAALVHRLRPMARVLLVRVCARALLQQLYRAGSGEGGGRERFLGGSKGAIQVPSHLPSAYRIVMCVVLLLLPTHFHITAPATAAAEAPRYLSEAGRASIAAHRPALLAASQALDALLSPQQCPLLVQAIVQVGGRGCVVG